MAVKVREKPAGSGIYWLFIDHKGKRKSKKIGTDRKLAFDAAKKIEAKLTLGDLGVLEEKKTTPLLRDYAEIWLNTYIKSIRRESTYLRYRSVLNLHIYPQFGKKPLDQIKRSDVKQFLLNLKIPGKLSKRSLSKSSISTIHHVLSGILNHAVDEELITSNIVSGIIRQLKMETTLRIAEPMTSQEVSLFLRTCAEHYPGHFALFLTGFRTGMRIGEIFALQWGDIDWNNRFIHVKRSYRHGKLTSTKSGKDRRVDMSDQLWNELRKLYAVRKKEAMNNGHDDKIIEVVFHRNGKYIRYKPIYTAFKKVLRIAGIREMRIHDMRHSFASLLLTKGYSPVYVKEQLGHHSISITVDTYGHLIPSSNRDAVNSLDDTPESATVRIPSASKKYQNVLTY